MTEGLGLRHLRLVLAIPWAACTPGSGARSIRLHRRDRPHGRPARAHVRSQLDDAADGDRRGSQRSGLEQRQLYRTAQAFRIANVFFGIATTGGTLALQAAGPDRAAADKVVDSRLAALTKMDANDYLYQWDASADYDPSADLGRISGAVLAISSADDERNPPETGIMEAGLKRVPQARLVLIPLAPRRAAWHHGHRAPVERRPAGLPRERTEAPAIGLEAQRLRRRCVPPGRAGAGPPALPA